MLTARRAGRSGKAQDGFTLIEVMLGVAGTMAVAAGGFYLYQVAATNADVRVEQENVRTITTNAQNIYGSTGSYAGVTTTQAISDEVPPTSMVAGSGLMSEWQTPVLLAPVSVDGKPNAGLELTYSAVPEEACTKFASQLADGMWDVEVAGTSVLATDGGRTLRGRVNPVLVAQNCANGAPVVLTFHRLESGLVSNIMPPVNFAPPPGSSVSPVSSSVPPSAPPVAPPPPPGVLPIAPPPPLPPTATPPPPGVITVVPPGTPPPSSPPMTTPPPPAGSASCIAPAPRTCGAACTDGNDGYETRVNNNTYSCPAGQLITTAGAYQYQSSGPQTRNEERFRTENASCPDPFDAPVWSAGAWQSWVGTSSWSPTYACAPSCSAPPPNVTTTPQSQPASCPAGSVTAGGATSFTQTRTRTNTINYSCSTPTGPVVAAPVAYTYTPWAPTVASTCTTACTAPAPSSAPITRAAPPETGNTCPAGYSGSTPVSRTRTENGTRTTSWTCPAPTGSATSSNSDSWLGTYNITSGWTPTAPSTCTPPPTCTAPAPSSTPITRAAPPAYRSPNCPAGQYGRLDQSQSITENGTRTTNWTCPGPASTSSDAWLGTFNYGAWATYNYTCASCPAPVTTTPTQWVPAGAPCPSGQTGSHTWEKQQSYSSTTSYNCPAGTTTLPPATVSSTGWGDTGATRNVVNTCTPTVPPGMCPTGQYPVLDRDDWYEYEGGAGMESSCQGDVWIVPGYFNFPGPMPNKSTCTLENINATGYKYSGGGYMEESTYSCLADHIVGQLGYRCSYSCQSTPPAPAPAPVAGTWTYVSDFGGSMADLYSFCNPATRNDPPARSCVVGERESAGNGYYLSCFGANTNTGYASYGYWDCR